ncbi:MAG: metal-binding protein [Vulcanococcus sp.]
MASGQQHDRATCWLALPYGLLWWPWLGPAGALTSGLAFLVGGLWLSPDLDTNSRPYQRWGPLRWLWWPYRKALRHRSIVSHAPVIGSAVRLGYLVCLLTGLSVLTSRWGAPAPEQLFGLSQQLWFSHRPWVIAALVGIEASTWLHLLQDGDPMPRLWRRR